MLSSSIYKARKTWPPDFSKLTPRHRFSLERRYRRRTQLKYSRPKLHRAVRLVTWSGAAFAVVYGIMWAPWPTENNAFTPVREWIQGMQASFWTSPAPPKKTVTAAALDRGI
ncbi:hypothetical protein DFH27DRAFT_614946 [Peziza echinospora]|nr:hypothetical protein DFH27DRAFT_614946 [Peziza echinospora]